MYRSLSRAARLVLAGLLALVIVPVLAAQEAQQGGTRPAGPPAGQEEQPPATSAQGQQPDAQVPSPPPFRTGINFVRVDALVTDRQGNAVRDLTQDDFEILEDGKPQKIESFRFIEVAGSSPEGELPRPIRTIHDEETELARDDVRLFVIFFDDYHVLRGSALGVKQHLIKFIKNQLGPMDIVGLMYPLTPFDEISYTRNFDALIKEIERWDGRKHDYRPRNELEERYAYYPAEVVERIRNQVSLSALKSLMNGLATKREGRKSVILVSEGYSNYLPPQMRDPIASMPGYGNPNRGRGMVGERTPDEQRYEERAEFFSNTDLLADLREVFTAANRSNTSIYALDPRGLSAFEYGIEHGVGLQRDRAGLEQGLNTLRTLAEETDGRAIVNTNDLERGLKQMVRDASSYYLLGYTATSPTDGKFKEIKVRVKRPGVEVRARKGYWALTNEDVEAATTSAARPGPDPEIGDALAEIETPLRARTVRTWIGTARGENGKTAVTLVWEPVTGAGASQRERPARVSVMAAGPKGSYFRGKVPDPANGSDAAGDGGGSAPTVTPATATASAGGHVTFEAPPGTMQLKLTVEGASGEVIDSDFRDIQVPDYTKAEPMISEPAVFRARTQRDLNQLQADANALPTTAREFSRTERLLLRFRAYAPGGGPATPTVRLLNRGGNRMADVPARPSAVLGEHGFEASLPLASLPPGDFLLEIALGDGEGATRELVGFRVTS